MLRDKRLVNSVRCNVDLLSGLGWLHPLRSVPRSNWLRSGRGSLQSAGGLSRRLGILILSDGDVSAVSADALIAAVRSCLEAGAKINKREQELV